MVGRLSERLEAIRLIEEHGSSYGFVTDMRAWDATTAESAAQEAAGTESTIRNGL